jgi:hypothetical protein
VGTPSAYCEEVAKKALLHSKSTVEPFMDRKISHSKIKAVKRMKKDVSSSNLSRKTSIHSQLDKSLFSTPISQTDTPVN